mmetsp:Transcript_40164/g.114504  ORF Transcript_40164/g.114504 Transcript_40164/m.114504 type:complete len:271 (+) Transcript_40164:372-1184(+)
MRCDPYVYVHAHTGRPAGESVCLSYDSFVSHPLGRMSCGELRFETIVLLLVPRLLVIVGDQLHHTLQVRVWLVGAADEVLDIPRILRLEQAEQHILQLVGVHRRVTLLGWRFPGGLLCDCSPGGGGAALIRTVVVVASRASCPDGHIRLVVAEQPGLVDTRRPLIGVGLDGLHATLRLCQLYPLFQFLLCGEVITEGHKGRRGLHLTLQTHHGLATLCGDSLDVDALGGFALHLVLPYRRPVHPHAAAGGRVRKHQTLHFPFPDNVSEDL